MLAKVLAAFGLMALCVVVHAIGVMSALRWVVRGSARAKRSFLRWTWRFVRLAAWMIVVHLVEISVWAWFYHMKQAMPDLQTAVYFSAATYTTVGYGDVVLPIEWRLIGGVEALTGILMCGWSTGFFFAVVTQMLEAQAPKRVTP
jgi:voltage-gated potassium channel Kch